LYVADIGAGKTYKYSIGTNGELSGKQLLMEYGSDGMTLYEKGNTYLTTGKGVLIFNAKREMIAQIKVPHEPLVTSVFRENIRIYSLSRPVKRFPFCR
jgi:gluconolactonase